MYHIFPKSRYLISFIKSVENIHLYISKYHTEFKIQHIKTKQNKTNKKSKKKAIFFLSSNLDLVKDLITRYLVKYHYPLVRIRNQPDFPACRKTLSLAGESIRTSVEDDAEEEFYRRLKMSPNEYQLLQGKNSPACFLIFYFSSYLKG